MKELFDPVPISQIPFFDREMVGIECLSQLAKTLYGTSDSVAPGPLRPPFRLEVDQGRPAITVQVPFASKEDLTLHREEGYIIVRIGSFKRHLPLPSELVNTPTADARIRDGVLCIAFGGPACAP